MATLEQIEARLKRIEKLLLHNQQPEQWTRVKKVMTELKITREQVRTMRKNNEGIARKKTNGQYEYNLSAMKQIAA